jgi:hypothetical protein
MLFAFLVVGLAAWVATAAAVAAVVGRTAVVRDLQVPGGGARWTAFRDRGRAGGQEDAQVSR